MSKKQENKDKKQKKYDVRQNVIGKGFDKHPEHINRKGRPKKVVNMINQQLKENGYEPLTKAQMTEAIQILLNLPINKVEEIASLKADKTKSFPVFVKLISKFLLSKSAEKTLFQILDRAYGSANQNITVSTPVINVHDEETKEMLKQINDTNDDD